MIKLTFKTGNNYGSKIWEEFCIYNTRYMSTKSQTRLKKTYLFMIEERFRRYSHFPHQVANKPDEENVNIFENVLQS